MTVADPAILLAAIRCSGSDWPRVVALPRHVLHLYSRRPRPTPAFLCCRAPPDRSDRLVSTVVGANLDIVEPRQMYANHAAECATTHNADLHGHRNSTKWSIYHCAE